MVSNNEPNAMSDVFLLILAGALMGFFGSIPLTGPIAVMAVNQAVKERFMRGFLIGVGGTLGELIYCGLAVAGVGAMIQQLPDARVWIRGFSAFLLLGVGVYFFWNTPDSENDELGSDVEAGDSGVDADENHSYVKAFSSGFSVAAFNPMLLLNWTAAVAFVFSHLDISPSPVVGAAFVVAIGVGVVGWYAVLMSGLRRYRDRIPTGALATVQRVMSVFVIGGALYLGVRTGMKFI
jgi:threonine/homoserine/homoserine lactone efflux protein